ncbi:MAG TPA: hypothetical protein VH092_26980 [Urbifossiella sp.]|nr:hypothetical protein [Urbifossiella sp.]
MTGVVLSALLLAPAAPPEAPWAELRVTDAATGRGVPLIELTTTNGLRFVTDSAGRVAFQEPGLMGREVYFEVRGHGYEAAKDGFGFAGAKVTPRAGAVSEIKLTRRIPAERLCRLTGEGRFRDTLLLGYPPPLADSPHPGKVAGQDSVQAIPYRGKVYWFWGDTNRMEYPLGLYRMAGATTPVPTPTTDLSAGLPFDYFADAKTGFARAMMPLPQRPEGVVWVFAPCLVPDADGKERMIAYYTRRKGLTSELEQGVAAFDDEKSIFVPLRELPLAEKWRKPSGHPIPFDDGGTRWLLFGSPTPNVRVPATLEAVLDPARYEAFTCATDGDPKRPDLDADGAPRWRWQKELPPTDSKTEQGWVKAGKLKPEHARFCPADAAKPGDRVVLHSGSVRWNEYRKRWVMLAGQIGGSSHLGEVWYAESAHPTGPFRRAVKVATHDRQTFYNVCHHGFLDRDGGRVIHFEGTFTRDFSGNPGRVPRYEYNQLLYRLDLTAEALALAR